MTYHAVASTPSILHHQHVAVLGLRRRGDGGPFMAAVRADHHFAVRVGVCHAAAGTVRQFDHQFVSVAIRGSGWGSI